MVKMIAWIRYFLLFNALAAVAALSACHDHNEFSTCSRSLDKCDLGCDPTVGCLQCRSDADCSGGKRACVLGTCEECANDADCRAGESCFPREHKCEPSCVRNSDCSHDAPLCQDSGECIGCRTNADCSGKEPICESKRAQCSQCASDADCSLARPACDLRDGTCQECLVDGHCPPGEACGADHKCKHVCTSNADCDGTRPLCSVSDGRCVACLGDSDCGVATPICADDGTCKAR